MRLALAAAAIAAVSALAFALARYAQYRAFIDTPYPPRSQTVFLTVPKGATFASVARRLEEKDVVSDAASLIVLARLRRVTGKIQAGEYEIETPILPEDVLDVFVSGSVRLYKVTVPEGFTARQIARRVERAGVGSADEFLRWAMAPETAHAFGVDADTLEGYLFPDTYNFSKTTTVDQLVEMMVRRFNQVADDAMRRKAAAADFTVNEWVTLASIVEKETGRPSERPRIASVFLNRLKLGMKLQSDPTVIYGIRNFDGNIRRKDLRAKTPYNTYVIDGLPPGPICSPGEDALRAVLKPEKTDYLYFVSKNNGSHHFSRTYKEHAAAVRRYQIERRSP